MSEPARLIAVLGIALAQGLLYLFLLPPWQHYDEPTHFEYAWLIANRGALPSPSSIDYSMRREVAASMLQHNFYWNLSPPNLITDYREISIGVSELGHPPIYYILLSLPLFLARHFDVVTQLYIARSMSLLLFLLTLVGVIGIVRQLTPSGHTLRWAVPLTIVFMPPIVDLMTAVNNDVGAVLAVTLFLWVATRTICYGINPLRFIGLVVGVLAATWTKNTASLTLVFLLLVLAVALWVQYRWRWRRLLVSVGCVFLVLAIALFGWGDAAYWYRWKDAAVQVLPTRVEAVASPVGPYAVSLITADEQAYLLNPILPEDMKSIAGTVVTVGGWVWADRPATIRGLGLLFSAPGQESLERVTRSITVTTTPTFVAWTFKVPLQTAALHVGLFGQTATRKAEPLRILLDGALLVPGEYPVNMPPVFDDASAHTGTWAGARFVNLLRNGSAEQGWPRLRPWFERMLIRYFPGSPAPVLASLFDIPLAGRFLVATVTPFVLSGFFTTFAWGHITLSGLAWKFFVWAMSLTALAGCAKWFLSSRRHGSDDLRPALLVLGVAGLLMGGATILRVLPLLDGRVLMPAARYAFPVIAPMALALAGGWWALWPRRYRTYGTLLLLFLLLGLNVASVWTIWSFYASLPIS